MQSEGYSVNTFEVVRPAKTGSVSSSSRTYGSWLLVSALIAVMLVGILKGSAYYRSLVGAYGLQSSAWDWSDIPGYSHLLTYAFLHGSPVHFLGNAIVLLFAGGLVERRLGCRTLAGLFVLGAVISGLSHLLLFPAETRPLLGVSGALAALLGAAAVVAGNLGVRVRIPGTTRSLELTLRLLLVFWFLFQLAELLQVFLPGQGDLQVAYWAHIAGFAVGVAFVYALRHFTSASSSRALGREPIPSAASAGD